MLLTVQYITCYGGENPYTTENSAVHQIIVSHQKTERCFSSPECGLLFCSRAHSAREGPSRFSSSDQPSGLFLRSWGEIFTSQWEDPPLGAELDPSLDSLLRMSAICNI